MLSTHSRCLSPTSCAIHEELACDGAANVDIFCVTDPCVKPRSRVSSLRNMSNVHADVYAVQYTNVSFALNRWMPDVKWDSMGSLFARLNLE